jgi:hypothetical protein
MSVLAGLSLGLSLAGVPVFAQAPSLVTAPAAATVYVGQTATFNVAAAGAAPLAYRWQLTATNLPDATGPTLILTNVAAGNAGFYQVIVTNAAGSVTSAPVALVVLALPTGVLRLGEYVTSVPEVPVFYTARGNETETGFSLTFNSATLANPRFVSALDLANPGSAPASVGRGGALPAVDAGSAEGVTVTEDRSQLTNGTFGVRLRFSPGFRLNPGETRLGKVVFDLQAGAAPMAAGLSLTNSPVSPLGPVIEGTNAVVALLPVVPQVEVVAAPKLDFQSGLFLQRLRVGYPGISTQAVTEISVNGLGTDTQGQAILLRNSIGISAFTGLPSLRLNGLLPGEVRTAVAEFYVTDLTTVPAPTYLVATDSGTTSPNLSPRTLAVDRSLYFTNAAFPGGAFLIEFPTDVGRTYFVQYAPSVEELNGVSTNRRTARPGIPGTGSRVQWIDAGPPKTESAPSNGTRFYRVILGL